MKLYLFFVLFFSFQLSAMHNEDKTEARHICDFAILPKPILDHIASYLELSMATYETNEFFKERLLTTKNRIPYKEEGNNKINTLHINDSQTLQITDRASLELVTKGKFRDKKKKLIQSNVEGNIIKLFYLVHKRDKGEFTPKDQVDFCSISSNKKIAVALVNNHKIHVVPLNQTSDTTIFPLESYYANEGFAGITYTQEENEQYSKHNYFTEIKYNILGYGSYISGFNEKANIKSLKWYKPITSLAVTNDGKTIAFSNEYQVFLANMADIFVCEKPYHMIHEDPIKPVGPFDCNGQKKFENFTNRPSALDCTPGCIRRIAFNNQGTRLAIVYDPYCEAIPDNIDTNMSVEDVYRILLQNLYSNQKHLFSNEEQKEIETSLYGTDTLEVAADNLFQILGKKPKDQIKIKIVLVPLKEDRWNLEKYMAKKGVCKNLNEQLTE